MPIHKLLGITAPKVAYPQLDNKFVQRASNSSDYAFAGANPNRPESRNADPNAGAVCGQNTYYLA